MHTRNLVSQIRSGFKALSSDFTGQRKSRRNRSASQAESRFFVEVSTLEERVLLAADATVLKDIFPGSTSSLPSPNTQQTPSQALNGWVYFNANDGTHGFELWRTDGTEANTQLFLDLTPGSGRSDPQNFIVANGKLFFTAAGGNLYVTNGTTVGTTLLMTSQKSNYAMGVVGSTAYYYYADPPVGNTQSPGGTFWKTDGTSGGTAAFATWDKPFPPEFSTVFENTMFFMAGLGELYKIDPVTSTVAIVSGSPSGISGLTATANNLFFPTNFAPGDSQVLWVLDSATGTPRTVQSPQSASIATRPENLCVVNNTLYFSGTTAANGTELWKSDGTSAGTVMVKDINPGTASSGPFSLVAVGGSVFFDANDGASGFELWKSSGSAGNTVLLKDTVPGPASGNPKPFLDLNGLLLFTAVTVPQLWTSDGTGPGTMPYGTIPNGTAPNGSKTWIPLENSVVFAGEDSTVGREMFVVRFGTPPAAPVITAPVAVTSSLRPTVTWNAVGAITKYEIWINNRSTQQNRIIVEPVTGTAFTPTFDLGIGNFAVWVRTAGSTNAPPSPWSAQYNFRINAPVILNPVTPSPVNGFPLISWPALPGAVKYDVWIDRLDVPTSQILRDPNVTLTSLTPTTLPNGRYRVWVRGLAVDGSDGAWSAPQDFSSAQAPVITALLNPTFDTTPTVTWTAVNGAASYELYVRSINGNFKAFDQKNIVGTSFTWPTLPAGPYEYWVRVTGSTVWSAPVALNTDGRTNVLTPIGSISDTTPNFSWQPVDGAVRYELWVDLQNPWTQKIVFQTSLTGTSFVSPSLPVGAYRTWVRAVSATNQFSPWSVPVDFTITGPTASLDVLPVKPSDDELLCGVLVSVFDRGESARTMEDGGADMQPVKAEHSPAALPLVLANPSIDEFIVQWMMNPMAEC